MPFVFLSPAYLTPNNVLKIYPFSLISMPLWQTNFCFLWICNQKWDSPEYIVLYLNVWATTALFYSLVVLIYILLNNVKELLDWLFSKDFIQARVTWEQGTSIGALPPSECLMGISKGHFLDWLVTDVGGGNLLRHWNQGLIHARQPGYQCLIHTREKLPHWWTYPPSIAFLDVLAVDFSLRQDLAGLGLSPYPRMALNACPCFHFSGEGESPCMHHHDQHKKYFVFLAEVTFSHLQNLYIVHISHHFLMVWLMKCIFSHHSY